MTLTTGTDTTEAMHFHIIYGHFIQMIARYFYAFALELVYSLLHLF